jgi:uncharacterized protein YndB with AHSA1/START domain
MKRTIAVLSLTVALGLMAAASLGVNASAQNAAKPASAVPANNADSLDAEQKLVLELTIPAPRAEVWRAFATSEGLSTWLFPNATVDLRPGGDWLVHFPGGSTGGGTIVSFVPEKDLVVMALAPDKFPTVRAQRTRAEFQFESKGENATVVRLIQTGWKDGEEWTKAYEYLAVGNAQLLATLHHRFVYGPTDWKSQQ